MKKSVLLFAFAVLVTMPATAETSSGNWAQNATAIGMAQAFETGWTTGDFVCRREGASVFVCDEFACGPVGCPVFCPPFSRGIFWVEARFSVPGDGQLDNAHDFQFDVLKNETTDRLDCFLGTVPSDNDAGLSAVATDPLLDDVPDPSCRNLVCSGGSNPGDACIQSADCTGGSCAGVCFGGTNPGAFCSSTLGPCSGGGVCAPPVNGLSECTVSGTHNIPSLSTWAYIAMTVGLVAIGVWVLRRRGAAAASA